MRGKRPFIFSFLFLLLLVLCGDGASAAASAKGATAWRGRYDAAAADFAALAKDAKKGGLRDSWETLAGRFTALQKEAKSKNAAAKAGFYRARCLEELARRSWNPSDFRKAGQAFAAVVAAYPKDPLAREAKERQAALREAAPENAARATAPAAEAADPKTAAELYRAAAEDWRALLRDSRRGMLRDPWLDLERRFLTALAKDPRGETGAKARFQAARCREELAERSHLRSDWQQAATQYLTLAADFSVSDLADDGLFRAAFILHKHLDDADSARDAAEQVIKRYPRGDMTASARELLASLPPERPAAPAKAGAADAVKKSGPFAQLSRLKQISWQGDGRLASVFLELDRPAAFTHQCLGPSKKGAPSRLQLELFDTRPGPGLKQDLRLPGKAISRARIALVGAETADNSKTRVVLDFSRVRRYTVTTRLSPPGISIQASASSDLAEGLVPPSADKNGPLLQGNFSDGDRSGTPGSLMEQLGLTVRTIMIDPGHGGKDPGAMGNGIRESDVTLQLAKMLGERLRKAGFAVLYTRGKNMYVALEQRTDMANKKKADLFISLHVNASQDKNLNGLETYFLDLARTSSAATVAARENAVSVKSISDLQFILTDLMLSAKLQESRELSRIMQNSAHARARKSGFSIADNGVRSAPFYVLMGARMPATLVEIGYLSNADDAKLLRSEAYLERLADGLAAGVTAYKQKLSKFVDR